MKSQQFGHRAALAFLSLISISSQSADTTYDACGKAAVAFNDALSDPNPRAHRIDPQIAYDCLVDVPFYQDDALTTIGQMRTYLQFYSAQTYFAHPPTPELELNPVDLNKTLDTIEKNIKSDKYPNHYSFNKDLFNLFGDYRDGHVTYSPLCYVPFNYLHDYPLVSVAETPDSIPCIHGAHVSPAGRFEIGDKVVEINGMDSVEYLTEMANNHPELTWVDPDARFNQLLISTGGSRGIFAARQTFETDELILTWENGTKTKIEWYAYLSASVDVDSFDSTETFYNNVCLRTQAQADEVLQGTSTKKMRGGADLAKEYSSLLRKRSDANETSLVPVMKLPGEELALYVVGDIGVIVSSAFSPNDESDEDFIPNFANLITDAIAYLKKKKISKLIIDVSENGGGFVALGLNFAQQLFPTVDHFFGSNLRWNPALAAMLTEGIDPNGTYWNLGHYHKMDGSDFSSYEEFLGPVYKDNDYFTEIARPDIVETNAEFSGIPGSYPGPQPFDAKNIVLVSSGMCGSTCAVFSEALVEQNVRTVAFGGRPREGPMQTVGGVKGSQVLSFDDIAYWAYNLLSDNPDIYHLESIPSVQIVATSGSTINLRNSWRKVDQDTPIEFIYSPSEYKLSYTSDMMFNQTLVWEAARDVVWDGAKDLSGGGSSGFNYGAVGSVAHEDDLATLDGSPTGNSSSHDDDDHAHGGSSWSSLGQLIWSKINGHGMDFDF